MLKKQYLIHCKEAGLSAQSSRVLTDIFHYVQLHPILLSNPIIPAQNLSHCSNVISNGSPSRIRIVRLISLGMTTRPRSSMRRTIPVAFILDSSRIGRVQPRPVYCNALENMDSIRRSWEGMQIFGWI